MSVTIKDVARSCGMSISTVSKVFNGYSDISEATRRQVMEMAHEIGYRPNALARALKTNRSYNLGVLFVDENISGLLHPFFAAVLNAFKAEVESRGYDITFINHNIGTMDMSYLEHCRYRNVDGVCLACVDFYSSEVAELVNSDLPCVTIDHTFNNRSSIISDNLNGMRMLVDRAAALGHRRIAYIHGQRNSSVTENRIRGFYRAMESHGDIYEAHRGEQLRVLLRTWDAYVRPSDKAACLREVFARWPEDEAVTAVCELGSNAVDILKGLVGQDYAFTNEHYYAMGVADGARAEREGIHATGTYRLGNAVGALPRKVLALMGR